MGVEQCRGGQGVIIYTSDMLLRTHAQGNKIQGHWRVDANNPRVCPDNKQAFGQYPRKTKRDLCLVLKRWIVFSWIWIDVVDIKLASFHHTIL